MIIAWCVQNLHGQSEVKVKLLLLMQILTKGVRDELLSEILNPSDLVAFVEALQTAKSLMTQNLHQHISFDFLPPA